MLFNQYKVAFDQHIIKFAIYESRKDVKNYKRRQKKRKKRKQKKEKKAKKHKKSKQIHKKEDE